MVLVGAEEVSVEFEQAVREVKRLTLQVDELERQLRDMQRRLRDEKTWALGVCDECDELRGMLTEHHAVSALDDARIGDDCPVCKRWREQHES